MVEELAVSLHDGGDLGEPSVEVALQIVKSEELGRGQVSDVGDGGVKGRGEVNESEVVSGDIDLCESVHNGVCGSGRVHVVASGTGVGSVDVDDRSVELSDRSCGVVSGSGCDTLEGIHIHDRVGEETEKVSSVAGNKTVGVGDVESGGVRDVGTDVTKP